MFESKENSLVSEDELKELLGCGPGVIRNMQRTGLKYIQIRDSKQSRFYLASDIISWAISQRDVPDALPLVRVKGSRYERVKPDETGSEK